MWNFIQSIDWGATVALAASVWGAIKGTRAAAKKLIKPKSLPLPPLPPKGR